MKTINIKFPLQDDTSKNRLFKMTISTKEALISDLYLLFKTRKGVRYYMSDYGTNLEKFIFEPHDSITLDEILEDLRDSVGKFMPNIRIDNVEFFSNTDEGYDDLKDNEINVKIGFTYADDIFSESGSINILF